jgi:hypothetical protein
MLADVAVGCRVLLAVVLVLAFTGKITSRSAWRGFTDSLAALPWLPKRRHPVLAIAILVAEGTGAVLLVLPGTSLAGLALATALLTGFTVVPAISLRRGVELTCRCFGLREAKIGLSHILKNGVALCAAVAGLVASQASGPGTTWSPISIGIGVLAGLVFVGWDEIAYLLQPPSPAQSHHGGRAHD